MLPLMEPDVARMVDVPPTTAKASPVELTVAAPVPFVALQVTEDVIFCVELSV